MQADYLNHMGTDLTVVNAARVSFGAESTDLSEGDKRLIRFLARGCKQQDWDEAVTDLRDDPCLTTDSIHELLMWAKQMPTHWTPFAHCMISVRETVPIFVARQRFKHTVGFVYNEVSRRYVDDAPEFHVPESWRTRPDAGIKQGSGTDTVDHITVDGIQATPSEWYSDLLAQAQMLYSNLIGDGVAPEQARMVLPQSMLTSYWVTGSLYAWANAYIQRTDSHAQQEIQALAAQWDAIINPLFPVAWSALINC